MPESAKLEISADIFDQPFQYRDHIERPQQGATGLFRPSFIVVPP
jgi:hypothetical protein